MAKVSGKHGLSGGGAGKRPGAGKVVLGAFAIAIVAIAALAAAVVVLRPPFAISAAGALDVDVPDLGFGGTALEAPSGQSSDSGFSGFGELGDVAATKEQEADLDESERRAQVAPIIATCDGVELHSAVALIDVTGIMFHQASYGYALSLETQLPEADYSTAADTRTIRVNREQHAADGDWADAEALHLWRTGDATEMDTSIDLGAFAGTEVRSPVTGTVVLVRDYQLYDEMPDVEIHIQPDGRDDLDCVLIHTTDPVVKSGERVVAGVTPIAKVRDIESVLTDVQLGFFTPEGVGGNHTHIQVNNANYPGYRESKLEGAVSAG